MVTNHAFLPKFLQPYQVNSLIRLGKDYDGGYLVDEKNITQSEVLISMGISDDWSFEEHFISKNDLPLYAFDASVSKLVYLKNAVRALVRVDKPLLIFHYLNVYFKYGRFFKNDRQHFKKLVGMDSDPRYISLSTIINTIVPSKFSRIFLKIDIEVGEYRILDEIIKFANNIEGLVIEFHDVDIHLEKIENFIKKFPLVLCHTHPNTFSPLNGKNIPFFIEFTFTSQPVIDRLVNEFPHKFDMPNFKKHSNFLLSFY